MADIIPYLTFNGNCRQAMQFYQGALGGDLKLQTVGEAPLSEGMPPDMKKLILHATLTSGNITIMATDLAPEQGLVKGNATSLMLRCSNKRQAAKWYNELSTGGESSNPLSATAQGSLFGGLTDRFGQHWLIHCSMQE